VARELLVCRGCNRETWGARAEIRERGGSLGSSFWRPTSRESRKREGIH
jgi:hypothetical protein